MKGGIKSGRGLTDQQVDQFISDYITEYSYHRYGQNDNLLSSLTADAISHGIGTSMLEWWTNSNTHHVLHKDLKIGMNSAYQEAALTGLYTVHKNPYSVVIADKTKFTRQYYKYVRMGAQRISATTPTCSDDQMCTVLDPLAFINTDGKYVVIVKADSGGDFSISGLPTGTYGIKYTTNTGSGYDVDLSDENLPAGQILTTNIPAAGAITVYAKTSTTPSNPPTPTTTTTPNPILGDADGDSNVNIDDYIIWVMQYLNYNPAPNADPDFNIDKEVDGEDYVIWYNNFGT